MDTFIYDLHSGRLDDLEFAIRALTKSPLESEKVIIVITSVLSWGCTPPKMVEDIPEPQYDENGNLIEPENIEQINKSKEEQNIDEEKKQAENEINQSKGNIKGDPGNEEALNKTKNSEKPQNNTLNFEDENVANNSMNPENNIAVINEEELKKQQELESLAKLPKKKVNKTLNNFLIEILKINI